MSVDRAAWEQKWHDEARAALGLGPELTWADELADEMVANHDVSPIDAVRPVGFDLFDRFESGYLYALWTRDHVYFVNSDVDYGYTIESRPRDSGWVMPTGPDLNRSVAVARLRSWMSGEGQ